MRWHRVEYDDATGYWWQRDLGNGEELYCDSVSGTWVACWFSGGHDIEIGRAATEDEAKALAVHWLRVRVTAWENALVEVEPMDDGE